MPGVGTSAFEEVGEGGGMRGSIQPLGGFEEVVEEDDESGISIFGTCQERRDDKREFQVTYDPLRTPCQSCRFAGCIFSVLWVEKRIRKCRS